MKCSVGKMADCIFQSVGPNFVARADAAGLFAKRSK